MSAVRKANADARLVAELIGSGADVARDALDVARSAMALPPEARAHTQPIISRESAEFNEALHTIDHLATASSGDETLLYSRRQYAADAARYRASERRFLKAVKARKKNQRSQLVTEKSLAEELDSPRAQSYMTEQAVRFAKEKFGHSGAIPDPVVLEWFGPLGRLCRASTGLIILQATARHSERDHKKPKHGDHADVTHVVVAGIVGGFVSSDETALELFKATWPERSGEGLDFESEFRTRLATL